MRRPVTTEMVGGKSPRQRIWESIRSRRVFTVREVWGDMTHNLHICTVKTYIDALVAGGYLTDCGDASYQLAVDVGLEAPRINKRGEPVTMGLAQEQMWGTLHRLGELSVRELAHHASTERVPVSEVAARDYLRNLYKAGYLREIKPGKGAGCTGKQTKYRLICRTGPRPPMVQRCNAIYDPNLHQVVWPTPDALLEAIDG